VIALAFFIFGALKGIGACEMFPFLSGTEAIQFGVLFVILAIVADMHYRMFEAPYDR
jgi:hypothetical protein